MIGFVLSNWRLVLSIVLVLVVSFFVFHYQSLRVENKRLNQELSNANAAIDILGKKLDSEHNINVKSDNIKRSLKGKEDGEVAPVLDAAIDSIDGLR